MARACLGSAGSANNSLCVCMHSPLDDYLLELGSAAHASLHASLPTLLMRTHIHTWPHNHATQRRSKARLSIARLHSHCLRVPHQRQHRHHSRLSAPPLPPQPLSQQWLSSPRADSMCVTLQSATRRFLADRLCAQRFTHLLILSALRQACLQLYSLSSQRSPSPLPAPAPHAPLPPPSAPSPSVLPSSAPAVLPLASSTIKIDYEHSFARPDFLKAF